MRPQARAPAVAGLFYPSDERELSRSVTALLASHARGIAASAPAPKAIIAPHAGYVYSGPIAASAYGRVRAIAPRLRRVVLLGPAHRIALRGLALPDADAFQTPLGTVPVDDQAASAVADLPQIVHSGDAHALEHSLEVHLPFLQMVLHGFSIVPLVVGTVTAEQVCEVLERLWGGEETLIVASSDLSHYFEYAQAQRIDRATVNAILDGRPTLTHEQACGGTAINGLLLAARKKGFAPELYDARNSGDTAGDRSRVVGYASLGFCPARTTRVRNIAPDDVGAVLLSIARASIGNALGVALTSNEDHPRLQDQGACFVTLWRYGRLRGCIGTLEAHRTLLEDVKSNARAAAFLDPRFQPLSSAELRSTLIEVSLLAPPEPLEFDSEEAVVARLASGRHGVILEHAGKRATLLPQVWEQISTARDFLVQLKRKARLADDFWADDIRVWRYSVSKWSERELV